MAKRETVTEHWQRACKAAQKRARRANVARLSEASGVSVSMIFRVRAGSHTPGPETVDALLAGLDELGVG